MPKACALPRRPYPRQGLAPADTLPPRDRDPRWRAVAAGDFAPAPGS